MEKFQELLIGLFTSNLAITVLGWLAWNVGLFTFTKDEYDDSGKAFPVKEYVSQHWDNWTWSAIWIPILLIIGYKGFDLSPLSPWAELKWSDVFYFGAGLAAESFKYAYKKWVKKKNDEIK